MNRIEIDNSSDEEEKFTCCYVLSNSEILIGTNKGRLLLGLINLDVLKNQGFSNNKMINVLKNEPTEKYSFQNNGAIRTIKELDADNLIILNELGGIIVYKKNLEECYQIQENLGGKYNKHWNLLVLNENNFITIGNYRQIKHWKREGDKFKFNLISSNGSAIFFIEWFDKNNNLFFTNDFKGKTDLWKFEGDKIYNINSFNIIGNLQHCVILDNKYMIGTTYHGEICIYNIKNQRLTVLESFLFSLYKGNYVWSSNELNKIVIGRDSNLILLSKEFSEIHEMEIEGKQIFSIKGVDLILTSKTIVRPNYSKQELFTDLIEYKYIKIGLVGDSGVGKTCFCKYLESEIFEETKSSFGKHVWTISLEEQRKLLLYDLAGQKSELYTFFPMIQDSDIIFIFFKGNDTHTFDQAVSYYKELNQKCPTTTFYFIQTFSDERPRVRDFYIKEKFDEMKLDINEHLFKISSKNGEGFDSIRNKIFNKFDWSKAHVIQRLRIFNIVEEKLHDLYKDQVKKITINNFSEIIEHIIDTFRLEKIIDFFSKLGFIEYISEDKEIIINDEEYSILYSEIPEYIDQKGGYVYTNDLIKDLGDNKIKKKYIKNILQYYKENDIGIFFKEDDAQNEMLIIERKLRDHLNIPAESLQELDKYSFENSNDKINIQQLLHFLSDKPLILEGISKNELLFKLIDNENYNRIYFKFDIDLSTIPNRKILIFGTNIKEDIEDFKIGKELLNFIEKLTGNSSYDSKTKENFKEELKTLLKTPYENAYLEFKKQLNLDTNEGKAKLIKEIIALANSSYQNENKAYLLVGIEERQNKIIGIHNVNNLGKLEQTISNFINEYINNGLNFQFIPIKVNKLYLWQQKNEISEEIPFSEEQKNENCNDQIIMIKLIRSPNQIYELKKDINFYDNNKSKRFDKFSAWKRTSSHTHKLSENERQILRKN
ncbi:MAG: RNA-binding domain-containing protein [Promethearchaeota archaeon]